MSTHPLSALRRVAGFLWLLGLIAAAALAKPVPEYRDGEGTGGGIAHPGWYRVTVNGDLVGPFQPGDACTLRNGQGAFYIWRGEPR